jgi:hypothetical protein
LLEDLVDHTAEAADQVGMELEVLEQAELSELCGLDVQDYSQQLV